jgi:spectinomycin phosphotransferase
VLEPPDLGDDQLVGALEAAYGIDVAAFAFLPSGASWGRRLWIVDWDEAVLAPKERDLMFVIGGGLRRDLVAPADTDRFLAGYGDATADPRLLAYYRAAWAVQDVVAYGREVLMAPGLGERSRWAAVDGFRSLFAPGNIVGLALLPPQW